MVTAERERQIRENLGLVHTVANRFRGRGIEYDDLYQSGCVGLIKAVDRFDPTLGYAFSTYAVPVIIGEIKRLFRDGGAVKVSRALKEKALHAARLREDFLRREGREPTIGELAELLSCDPAEAAEIVGVMQPTVSINSAGEDGDATLDIPVDDSEQLFDRLTVLQAMDGLEKSEQMLVELRYYKGLTQCKTAEILGLSQVQVSRKEKAVLQKCAVLWTDEVQKATTTAHSGCRFFLFPRTVDGFPLCGHLNKPLACALSPAGNRRCAFLFILYGDCFKRFYLRITSYRKGCCQATAAFPFRVVFKKS